MDDIVFDDINDLEDDSSPDLANMKDPGVLKVYKTGEVTVVGFGGKDVPSETCIAFYRDELSRLIDEYQCKVLGFDLTGVILVPSGMLGVMTSLRKKVDRLEIYNPSPDVREVLHLSRLERFFDLKDAPFEEK